MKIRSLRMILLANLIVVPLCAMEQSDEPNGWTDLGDHSDIKTASSCSVPGLASKSLPRIVQSPLPDSRDLAEDSQPDDASENEKDDDQTTEDSRSPKGFAARLPDLVESDSTSSSSSRLTPEELKKRVLGHALRTCTLNVPEQASSSIPPALSAAPHEQETPTYTGLEGARKLLSNAKNLVAQAQALINTNASPFLLFMNSVQVVEDDISQLQKKKLFQQKSAREYLESVYFNHLKNDANQLPAGSATYDNNLTLVQVSDVAKFDATIAELNKIPQQIHDCLTEFANKKKRSKVFNIKK